MSVPVKINRKVFSRSKKSIPEEESRGEEEIMPNNDGKTPREEEAVLEERREDDNNEADDIFAELKGLQAREDMSSLPPPPAVVEKPPSPKQRKRKQKGFKDYFPNDSEYVDLFDVKPTPILGREKRELLTRVKEYKCLFPDELSKFKVKNNANEAELEEALQEMETIVSCGTVQQLLDECLLSAIAVVEGISSHTNNFDITGTSEALRANPQFYKLCKMCWIKYRVLSDVPPELQLTLVVMSTAMVCRQHNIKRQGIANILNTPL